MRPATAASCSSRYRDAVQRRPEDADARTSLGQMLVRLKRTEEALPHFERAIALDPQRPAHHVNLGNAFAQLQRWDEAIDAAPRAADAAGRLVTTFDLAKALHRKGDDAAAVTEFQRVIGLDPNDPSVRIGIGGELRSVEPAAAGGRGLNQFGSWRHQAPTPTRRGCGLRD